jgi:hypothetical protein
MTDKTTSVRRTLIFVSLFAVMVAGCSSGDYLGKPKEPDPNLFPSNYKREILDTMTTTLEDPTNVRGAFITDPALVTVGNDQRYAACVRFNARNVARQYKGSTDKIAFFFGGHLNQLIDASPEQCGKAAYKAFPELEKLCLGSKCE